MKPRKNQHFATPDDAEHAFYEAMEQGDLAQLMDVWSDDEEIVCIHPGGQRLVGHDAVQSSWQEILNTAPVPIRPTRQHALQSMMNAVHTLEEELTVETSSGKQVVHCYATNVFHKGPTGWRMVLHHASHAPDDLGAADHPDVPDMLH